MSPKHAAMDDATRSRLALEAASTGIWDWHLPSGELYLSPIWKAQLGFKDEELSNVYKTWETRVHPDDLPGVLARLNAYLDGNLPVFDAEYRMHAKDGGYRWIRARGQITERDAAGQPMRLIGIHDDITGRKETELALRRSEDKFVNLFELSPDAIGISRLVDGRLVEVNRALEEVTGYRRDELIGTSTLNLWIDPQARAEMVARVSRNLDVAAEIHQFKARDGHIVDGLVSIRRIEHAGEPHLLFVVRDISALTAAEQALRESEARYREAQRIARLGHWSLDATARRFMWWSDEMFELFGIEATEGCPGLDLYLQRTHPDDRDTIQEALGEIHSKGGAFTVRQRVMASDDAIRHLEVHGVPVLGADGRIERITGTALDVTERVEAALALENRARETEWLMKSMSSAFIIWGIGYDAAGKCDDLRFEYFNDAYARASGLRFADVQGKSIHQVWPDAEPEWFEIYGRVARSGQPEKFERYFASTGGWYACSAYRPWPDTHRICVIFDDITERRRVEHALRDSEARWQFALEGAGAGVWDWHIPSNALYLAPGWKAQLGYQDHELPNEYDTWASRVHPEDLPGVKVALDDCLAGRRAEYDVEFRMRAKSGDDLWIRARGKIVERDAAGSPVRMIGVHDDITARKQTELALQRRIVALTRPLGPSEDIQFSELVNLDDIQELQDLFADAFGVASLITTPEGVPITRPSHFSRLCGEFIRKNAEGVQRCEHSDAILGQYNPRGPNIQHCLSAGLCNAGASITVGGHHVANWLIGQVRDETHNDRQIIRFANEIGADADELVSAFHDVPEMPRDQFERIARILYVMANQISTMAYQNVQQARFIAERQRAEENLRTFQSLAEASVDAIVMADPLDATLTYANPAAHQVFACDAAQREMIGMPGRDFWPEEDHDQLAYVLEQAIIQGWRGDVRQKRRDGRVFDANVTVFALRDSQGAPRHIVAIIRDVTERKRAENALRLTQFSVDHASEAIFWLDRQARFNYVNDEACRLLGYSRDELLRLGVLDVDTTVTPESLPDIIEAHIRDGSVQMDSVLRRKDGSLVDVAITSMYIHFDDQDRLVTHIRDISDQKRAEEALRREKQFSDSLVDGLPGIFYLFDEQGRLLRWNRNFIEITGLTEEQIAGTSLAEFLIDEDREHVLEKVRDVFEKGESFVEGRLRTARGLTPAFLFSGIQMRNSEGRYLIGMGIDISERRRVEESLRLSETRFRAVVENITEVISILDVNGVSLYQSPSLTKIYGYEQDDFIGRNGLSLVHPDDLDKALEHFAALLASPGTVSTLAYRYRHANGGWVDVESNAVALLDEPAIGGVLITSRDITTRKRVERALAEREAYLKTILDSQPECVKLLDRQGHLLDMNLAGLAMLEADSLEQVRGHCVCPLVTDHDRAAFMESLEAVFRGESRRITFQITTLKGNHRWLETHAVPIWEEGGIPQVQSCLGLTRDITERHDMDEALRLTQYALDQYSDGVFRINREGRFEYVNREACRNLGYSEDELLTMHVWDIDPDFPAERWPEQWQLLESMGKKLFESRHRRKDGSIYPVEVSSNFVRLGEREVHIAYVRDITERERSEHALHLTRHAIDVAALAFEWYDDTGRIIDVNTQCCKDLGYSRDEMLQLRLCDIDPDFPAEQWDSVWQDIKASGSLTAETTHRRKDGSLFPVLVTANHVEFDGREYIFTYAQDVTERNRVERELKATQHAINHASAAFEWINAEGQVISCNIQAHRALGYERDEFVGLRVWDYDPDMSPERWRTLWDALRRDGHAMLESHHRRKDGSVFPIEVTVNYVVFSDHEYCFAYITDISERKAAEERLRLTQYAVDSSSIAFQWIRQDGRVMGCNRRAHESLGLTREELIGMHVWDFDPDFHAEGMAAHWVELKRVGKMTFETRHRHKDGHVFQVEVTSNYGEFDGQEYTFTYSVDITERKAAEEHLRLIQYAVDSSSVAFEWLDLDGKIISGNILAYESLGYTRDEFVDLHVWDFTPGLTVELWRAHVAQLRERGSEFIEGEHRRKDGTVFPIEVRANYVQFGEREYVFSYINDISERKVAEQALRDSQRRLAELIDFLPDATFAIDTQGVVIAWNRAMEAMSGASKESVLGQGDRAYAQAFYGHKRPMLVDLLFNDDPSIAKSYSVLRREGEALVTEDQIAYLYGGRRIALWAKTAPLRDAEGRVTGAVEVIRDITEQKEAERELRFSEERFRSVVSNTPVLIFEFDDEGVFKLSEGRGLMALGMKPGQLVYTSVCEFFHDDSVVCEHIREAIAGKPAQFTARVGKAVFETFFNPVSDARSGRVSVIGVAVDITERTEREADLQQKTDEMTRFTYTVSHDLKSPLVTIRTFLGFLEQDIHKQDDERIAKDMGFIRNAAERMARLLEELLELSRIGRVVNNPVDTPFGALVHEAVGLVAGRIAERGVDVSVDDPPLLIHGDRPRLVEVFQNLIDNAVKFMGTQAKPRVEIGAEARDGNWVFHVRDNGMGVDARYLDKVFGLFEKLDPSAEGTGIGLTLVKRIIEVHGGRIWVESAGLGQGTSMYFTLDGAAVRQGRVA